MKSSKRFKSALGALVFTMLATFSHAQSNSYCASQGRTNNYFSTWISQFKLASINNASGNNGGYGNYTSQSTTVALNSSQSFTITPGSNGLFSGNARYYARIWVDYNGDGNFNNSNELAYQGQGIGPLSGTIAIPSVVSVSNTRMRLIVKRSSYPDACGNYKYGETEDYSLSLVSCNAFAGTLTAASSSLCFNGASTAISATPDGNAIVPAGYQKIYVLTLGSGLIINQVSTTPNFTVSGTGLFTIHTLVYDPNTLDLSIVVFGVTTGVDVNGLLVQGGGSICASLDVAGAPVIIATPSAGTLTATSSSVCFNGTSTTISANPDGNAVVPAGYQKIYVLTSGAGLVIKQVSAAPNFTVSGTGLYTIHTLVYDPNTLDLSIVVFGVTTGVDVNGLLIQGGGSICASLDVAGARVTLANPTAGTLTAASSSLCFSGASTAISATPDGNAIVPAGYQKMYVLTSGAGLVIRQVSTTPNFTVTGTGLYTIHTLVYDPNTLDLSIVVFGVTTGVDVNGLLVQGGGSICASLDVAGAQVVIATPSAGTLTSTSSSVCFTGTSTAISATPDGSAIVPAGYQKIYVLTSGAGLVIKQVSATPNFVVSERGLYTIHTLVYDPNTLDLSIVVFGVTTGVDVNGLLIQGGGSICASLDVAGARVTIAGPSAGTITSDNLILCLDNGSATISASPNGNAIVPAGYQTIYVLTKGQGLVIQQAGATPSFTVGQVGLYRIHTLVYDPTTLNLGIVVPGVTTGFDVNGLLVQGGGSICAALDVAGAPAIVFGPRICNAFDWRYRSAPTDAVSLEALRISAEEEAMTTISATIYPNPAKDNANLSIELVKDGKVYISIYDVTGKKVLYSAKVMQAGFNTEVLSLENVSEGTYIVHIESENESKHERLVIVK